MEMWVSQGQVSVGEGFLGEWREGLGVGEGGLECGAGLKGTVSPRARKVQVETDFEERVQEVWSVTQQGTHLGLMAPARHCDTWERGRGR